VGERTRPDEPSGEAPGGGGFRRVGRAFALASSIGVPFAVLVSCGAFAGLKLDKRLGTAPWLLLAGIVLGAVAAFVNLFRVVAWYQREEGAPEAASKRAPDASTRGPT